MVKTALKEISRGCAEIIDMESIEKNVKKFFEEGRRYTVKAGFDPTAPDLHLGHTVLLQKLSVFQKYGADVQFLIGDFTAKIGDPTGKSVTRKLLTEEQIKENAASYHEQVFKILNHEHTRTVFNSEWIEPLGAAGMLELTTLYNVARMLERDDFDKRYKSGTSISISEFLYPLLQGYDSVHLKSDIEIGGTDQKFNLLMGRHLQRSYNVGKEQAVLMMPILEGLDGVQKMSKSLNNYIGVTDSAKDMFAKVLSISDELMWRYYELLSDKTLEEIKTLEQNVASGDVHPKRAKEMLALEITARFHGQEAAEMAKAEFDRVHSKNDLPTDMPSFELDGPIWVAKALHECNLEASTTQARRDIKQGAVKIDQIKVQDEQLQLDAGEYVLQVGKRKFAVLKVK
jgi:tyrosyl-tRNA synthetase